MFMTTEQMPPISHEIKVLSNAVGRKMDHNMRKSGIDTVTAMHGRIIGFIKKSESDVFQRDIEQEFGISRATVTNIIKLMEKKGYIERSSDESDMRLKKLALTPLGKKTDEKILSCLKMTDSQLIENIDENDLCAFYRVAEAIRQNCASGDK